MSTQVNETRILVTGATGYVGGRLVPLLLRRGYRVRCMARDPRKLAGRWEKDILSEGQLEVVSGDVLKPETLSAALKDIDVTYYLMHAMGDGEKDFAQREKKSATDFARAVEEQGVKRIIFLGGLGRRDEPSSEHLESRHKTGDLLRTGKTPVTELRAAVIVGSGSASFEMLRHLTEKLPIMVTPRWVDTKTQPISINDTLSYLVAALETPETAGRVLDIGGPDVLTYRDMMTTYADVRGLKRIILTVPVLTPRFSAYWVNLVTPIPASLAFPLIEGLKIETVCENDDAQRLMPMHLATFREAVVQALRDTEELSIPTHWTGAHRGPIPTLFDPTSDSAYKLLSNIQVVPTTASASALRLAFSRIGGTAGWYYADRLWMIRGMMDRAIGGVGVRRGRRHPEHVAVGDAIDFWRVEDYGRDYMRLRAEMKVPGRAWLEFRIKEHEDGTRALIQTAFYDPGSIWGKLYWYSLIPVHYFVFRGMANGIVAWAEKQEQKPLAESGAPA